MSIEKLITDLTAAIDKNTAWLEKTWTNWNDKQDDGVPAFAKQAKEAAAQKTAAAAVSEGILPVTESSVANIADAPKKRGPKPKAAAPEPTVYDKLCVLVTQLVDNNQTDKIIGVFDQFGVKKASQLAPEQHQEAYELLEAEINGSTAVERLPEVTASFV